jgi:Protein of unknown function (DUF2786)
MPVTNTIADHAKLLGRVRKLLAKAEDESVTPPEAEALTAKAAELMAKYGIDQALLDATRKPEDNKPSNRKLGVPNPWGRVKSHLLCGIASAMGCQAILLTRNTGQTVVHLFGFQSDIERVDVMYTSLLLQMNHGLVRAVVPTWSRSPRAWRRSWMLGFTSAAIAKVRQAENAARKEAEQEATTGTSTALVLADRSLQVKAAVSAEYPHTHTARVTYSGTGYRDGYAKGQQANIGGTGVGRGARGALTA